MTDTHDLFTLAAATSLTRLPLTSIKAGINPRTEFDADELAALAQTFDEHGPVQPIIVYHDVTDGLYGLIAGERRWRAAGIKGLETIEVIVRDKPVEKDQRKMALLENMQRKDLTPLEVAWAVRDLLALVNPETDLAVYSRGQLADELGQDKSFISRCEALLRCSDKLQKAVHTGKVPMELAAMIGSLPADMQETAETDIVFRTVGPMNRDQAREHIAEKYRRDLRHGQFDRDVIDLVKGRPACGKCEFNGANRNDVAGKNKVHVCLNPACFEAKQLAFVELTRKHNEEGTGKRMLGEDQRSRIFGHDGTTVNGDSGWVAGDELPHGILLVDPKSKVPVWSTILDGSELEEVQILDGQGGLRTLYDARLALQAATTQGGKYAAAFKGQSAASGASSSRSSATSSAKPVAATDDHAAKVAAARRKAGEEMRVRAGILAGQNWFKAMMDSDKPAPILQELVNLVVERLTEPADQQWMAQVMTGSVKPVGSPMELIMESSKFPTDALEVIALALVARSMRLQGPATVGGITGDLCKLTGYDPKREARELEKVVKDAEDAAEKALPAPKEELFDCAECGGKNFTKRGLAAHKCAKRKAKNAAEAEAPSDVPRKPEEVGGHAEFARLRAEPSYTKDNLGVGAYNWLAVLMGQCVLKIVPNGSGVLVHVRSPEPLAWKGAKKHENFNLGLVIHEETGLWHFRYELELLSGGCSGPANIKDLGYATRQHAVVEGLRFLHRQAAKTESAAILIGKIAEVVLKAFPELDHVAAPAKKPKNLANPEAEAKALKAYLETGSLEEAAAVCGKPLGTVQNWHKRRKWKAQREAHLTTLEA